MSARATWRNPRTWIAIASAVIVLLVALSDLGRSAPGPVATVHGQLAELNGGQSCRQCHGGLFSSMTESCLTCHAPIKAQLENGNGVHGRLGTQRASQCAMCHSEHHGGDFPLVNSVSFAQAGVGDPNTFDHGLIGFDMHGRHAELACAQCHLLANAAVLPPGERRFLGLQQTCTTCHHDPHQDRMQLACAACHGQDSFRQLIAPEHDKVLPLVGGHQGVACATCHGSDTAHSLDLVGSRQQTQARTCVDCHTSPHRPAFTVGAADGCASCHEPDHTTFAAAASLLTPAQHALGGHALTPPHDQATCAQCHGPQGASFAMRHPGRGADDCSACHEDPHAGQFADDPLAVGGCIACHARTHFAPHVFTTAQHALAALPLQGSHLDADCHRCHLQPTPREPRTFRGTTAQCDGCHADAHDGFFAEALSTRPEIAHGNCAHCHTATQFNKPLPGFDHGAWTGFALNGSHAEATCDTCHGQRQAKDAHGRSFGRVADRFLPRAGCVRCHQDPHAGRFDGAHLPAEVAGRSGCARCHGEASFRALPTTFEHGKWTGFALDQSHSKVACSGCHAPLPSADGGTSSIEPTRSFARAKGGACADCHQDPHGGQFVVDGRVDCARCHQPLHFKSLVFNHNLDARFVLGDAHQAVACAACHKAERISGHTGGHTGERDVARYRPLPHACVDCHGKHEEQLRRRPRRGQ